MKRSQSQVQSPVQRIPRVQFDSDGRLTSFGGLILFQALFQNLNLRDRLLGCFAHLDADAGYRRGLLFLLLIVHLLLGFRRLRGLDVYRDDPLVKRLLGLDTLPDVATLSRSLAAADDCSLRAVRQVNRELVLNRLTRAQFRRLTLDFDGSVLSSRKHAEGSAVGFNRKRKGERSYYPLFCTIAQTGQFFDLHHRPGNVHDSNGAPAFMKSCGDAVRQRCPNVQLEARLDAAFFDQKILDFLHHEGWAFTCSVPFQRFPRLKAIVEATQDWRRINDTWSYFESDWHPKSWDSTRGYRFLLLRKRRLVQRKGPLQLDLFEPRDYQFDYKVVLTNRPHTASNVLHFHHGRGGQEKILGEGKHNAGLGLIATRTLRGNQLYTQAAMLAHNLSRELQMTLTPPERSSFPKRPARWFFETLGTLRNRLLRRPARLTWPQRYPTLTIGAAPEIQNDIQRYLQALQCPS